MYLCAQGPRPGLGSVPIIANNVRLSNEKQEKINKNREISLLHKRIERFLVKIVGFVLYRFFV